MKVENVKCYYFFYIHDIVLCDVLYIALSICCITISATFLQPFKSWALTFNLEEESKQESSWEKFIICY